jgi:hypothetical protein
MVANVARRQVLIPSVKEEFVNGQEFVLLGDGRWEYYREGFYFSIVDIVALVKGVVCS